MTNSYKCLSNKKSTNWDIKGVSLGGLFVLEPWITPSLFYQFLNKKNPKNIGMDTYTFCQVLGPKEGRRQLNEHFYNWVNETDIKQISKRKITHVRIPIGDWMFEPYGPYIGCTDDSLFHLDRIINLCSKYSLKILLDLHGVKDSQNGLDNSGRSMNVEFAVAPTNYRYDGALTFIHWPIISGNWIGDFDQKNKTYKNINYSNIESTKNILYKIIEKYKSNKFIFGIEPLNEPWIYTPTIILKNFYYDIYKYIYYNAPHLHFIYHNSFRDDIWDNFLVNCSNVAIDWHIYQAWNNIRYGDQFLLEADSYTNIINTYGKKGIQVVIGEYSLATDNCAMWLNGFQDNIEGFPVTECKFTPCPFPYINTTDLNRIEEIKSPFGTGISMPHLGTCPYEGLLVIDQNNNDFLRKLNVKKIESFSKSQGWFFWNFKTEIKEEISWNYIESFDNHLFKGTDIDPNNNYNILKIGIFLFGLTFLIGGLVKLFQICYSKKKDNGYVVINMPPINEDFKPKSILKNKINKSTGNLPNNYNSIDI